jgi:hypothetical protein
MNLARRRPCVCINTVTERTKKRCQVHSSADGTKAFSKLTARRRSSRVNVKRQLARAILKARQVTIHLPCGSFGADLANRHYD